MQSAKCKLWFRCGIYTLQFTICILHFALPFSYADDPVEAIQFTYQNLTDLEARFTQQTVLEAVGKTVQNNGTLALKKPGQLRLEYRGTPQRDYVSDGKRLWVSTPGDLQYQVFPVGGAMVPREALTFLNGFGTLQRTFAATTYAPEKPEHGHTYLRLRPRSRTGYRQLDCEFDQRHLLVGLTIYNMSGNQSYYRFSDVRINAGIGAERFRFVPAAGMREVRAETK